MRKRARRLACAALRRTSREGDARRTRPPRALHAAGIPPPVSKPAAASPATATAVSWTRTAPARWPKGLYAASLAPRLRSPQPESMTGLPSNLASCSVRHLVEQAGSRSHRSRADRCRAGGRRRRRAGERVVRPACGRRRVCRLLCPRPRSPSRNAVRSVLCPLPEPRAARSGRARRAGRRREGRPGGRAPASRSARLPRASGRAGRRRRRPRCAAMSRHARPRAAAPRSRVRPSPQRRASARSTGKSSVASVAVQPGGRCGPASRSGPGISPACGPGPVNWVRARVRRVPAARRVPRGNAIRAAASASAGASPQRHGTPAARWTSAGFARVAQRATTRGPGSMSAATRPRRGPSLTARACASGLAAPPRPTAVKGAVPSMWTRSSTLQVAPGGRASSQRSSPADASASVGAGSAVTAACPVAEDHRSPAAWTLAVSSGPGRPEATAPSSARSVPRAISTGRRRVRGDALRRVIRSRPVGMARPFDDARPGPVPRLVQRTACPRTGPRPPRPCGPAPGAARSRRRSGGSATAGGAPPGRTPPAPARQLPLFRRDRQPRQGDADQRGVGGRQTLRSGRARRDVRKGQRNRVLRGRETTRRPAPACDVGGSSRRLPGCVVPSAVGRAPSGVEDGTVMGIGWLPPRSVRLERVRPLVDGSAGSGVSVWRNPAVDSATQVNGTGPAGVTRSPRDADRMAAGPGGDGVVAGRGRQRLRGLDSPVAEAGAPQGAPGSARRTPFRGSEPAHLPAGCTPLLPIPSGPGRRRTDSPALAIRSPALVARRVPTSVRPPRGSGLTDGTPAGPCGPAARAAHLTARLTRPAPGRTGTALGAHTGSPSPGRLRDHGCRTRRTRRRTGRRGDRAGIGRTVPPVHGRPARRAGSGGCDSGSRPSLHAWCRRRAKR